MRFKILVVFAVVFLLVGCNAMPTPSYPVPSPLPTYTPYPTLTPKEDAPFGVNLIGASFEIEDWNPRAIDLRDAKDNGIPASPGHSLKFFDFTVFAPDESIGYSVLVEVYANGELIGVTGKQLLTPGVNEFSDIQIKAYHHDAVENTWRVQDNWEYLQISTILYHQNDVISFTENLIRLQPDGTSWFISPPYASIVSIVYRINDGPEIIADLRTLQGTGINLESGDKFTVLEAWYQADYKKSDALLEFEAYLGSGTYDSDSLKISKKTAFELGIHDLLATEDFEWDVPDGKTTIALTLAKDNVTVLDRLIIPISSQTAPGLIVNEKIVTWPFEDVDYFDFESSSDFTGWIETEGVTYTQSSEQMFSGEYSMEIGFSEDLDNNIFIERVQDYEFDLIIGEIFWPEQDGVNVSWVQICAHTCIVIPTRMNQWNHFELSISNIEHFDEGFSPKSRFWIQGRIEGVNEENPYTFYIDGIQIYKADKK